MRGRVTLTGHRSPAMKIEGVKVEKDDAIGVIDCMVDVCVCGKSRPAEYYL